MRKGCNAALTVVLVVTKFRSLNYANVSPPGFIPVLRLGYWVELLFELVTDVRLWKYPDMVVNFLRT